MKQNNNNLQQYEAPVVNLIRFVAEQGFGASEVDGSTSDNNNGYEDGGNGVLWD